MRCFMSGIAAAAVAAALFHAERAWGEPAAVVEDGHVVDRHLPVALDQGSGIEGEDIIFECTAYFTACEPPDDESCFYIGRDPDEEVARMEALNECKFENPRRGRYCMVESCEEIERPEAP